MAVRMRSRRIETEMVGAPVSEESAVGGLMITQMPDVVKAMMIPLTLGGRTGNYLPAWARIVWFRLTHPQLSLKTECVGLQMLGPDGYAIFKASLYDESGNCIQTASKQETRADFKDFLEKAETGAIGRCLAMAGFGSFFTPDVTEGFITDSPASTEKPKRAAKEKVAPTEEQVAVQTATVAAVEQEVSQPTAPVNVAPSDPVQMVHDSTPRVAPPVAPTIQFNGLPTNLELSTPQVLGAEEPAVQFVPAAPVAVTFGEPEDTRTSQTKLIMTMRQLGVDCDSEAGRKYIRALCHYLLQHNDASMGLKPINRPWDIGFLQDDFDAILKHLSPYIHNCTANGVRFGSELNPATFGAPEAPVVF